MLIAVIAAVPSIVADVGMSVQPLRIEAILLTVLVFFGANVAFLLLFEETPGTRTPAREP